MPLTFFTRSVARSATLCAVAAVIGAAAPAAAVPAAAVPAAAVPSAAVPSAAPPPGSRVTIPPGTRGFDTLRVESRAQLACLKSAGYAFDVIDAAGTVWPSELAAARTVGMRAVLFQGFDPATWPVATKGTERGTIVAQRARQAGYPSSGHIYLNFEQNTNASAATLRTWVANWAKAVTTRGYVPGVYVGVPQKLTAAQLSALPGIPVFWRSASSSAPQLARGYVLRQQAVSRGACRIPGGIDIDLAGRDAAGHQLVGER